MKKKILITLLMQFQIGYGRSGQTPFNNFLISKLEYLKKILIKRRTLQKHVQNDIGIYQNIHFRYFTSLSSRICSRLISPIWAAIPRSLSARGVAPAPSFFVAILSCFSETGVTFSSTRAGPVGISFGARNSKNILRSAEISTVCSIVMGTY